MYKVIDGLADVKFWNKSVTIDRGGKNLAHTFLMGVSHPIRPIHFIGQYFYLFYYLIDTYSGI